MNETLATALGNGVLEERLRGDDFQEYFDLAESFYALPDVDAAAKAVFPLVRDYVEDNRPMDPQFVDRYFALVFQRLGSELDSLGARLRVSAFVASDSELAATANGLPRLLRITSQYGSDLFSGDSLADSVLFRHSYLNGIVLTRTKDRADFRLLAPRIDEISIPPFTDVVSCTMERDSGAVLYVIVTDRARLGSGPHAGASRSLR